MIQDCLQNMLDFSHKKAKRNFVETVELQVRLKNYDVCRQRRFGVSMSPFLHSSNVLIPSYFSLCSELFLSYELLCPIL